MTSQRFDDRRMEAVMGRLLQFGVLLASTVVAIGGVLYAKTRGYGAVRYSTFVCRPTNLRHPMELIRNIATGDPAAIIQLGVLLLVATPIARVVFAVIGFAVERDRLYVAISLFVLAVLMFGLLHGS